MPKRRFAREFKLSAVKLVREHGYSIVDAAKSLGIDPAKCPWLGRQVPRSTDSRHQRPVAANLLDRDFVASGPDRKWVADITYVPTDLGWLYLAGVLNCYQQLLKSNHEEPSMSGKGDCWDNAMMESFWATLKTDLIHQSRYATRDQARQSIFEYIEIFYNRKRLHSR